MADKTEFKTVDNTGMNLEEINRQVRRHWRKIIRRILILLGLVVIIFLSARLWTMMRTYDAYDIRSSVKRSGSDTAKFRAFNGLLAEYSNDGIVCRGSGGELIWNQSFEMNTPTVEECEDYLVVYDKGGTEICIMTMSGLENRLETAKPIQRVCVARQGTIAVLMRDGNISYIKLYDRDGNELANGQFYGEKEGLPVDIALSHDAKKLAIDMIDVSEGIVKSTVAFYNFGSVGQNEIDNNVGSYSFKNIYITEISYLSDSRMIGIADAEYIIFDGKEKPQVSREVAFEQNITSVFYNENYVGVTTPNSGGNYPYHIRLYDMKGRTVMENDTFLQYDAVEFLDNDDVCVRTENSCELFTPRGVRKFHYQFDEKLYYVMSLDKYRNYIFVFENTKEEVRLK